ncbi:MAG: hypothetical protein O2V44_07190, partial [Candidatus Bathyarchaeota archaeon]|nr:hypothetical protein [Candidatus Bathyarchaeota archaeon]
MREDYVEGLKVERVEKLTRPKYESWMDIVGWKIMDVVDYWGFMIRLRLFIHQTYMRATMRAIG